MPEISTANLTALELGRRVRAARALSGMSATTDLATALGGRPSARTLNTLERGEGTKPKVDVLRRIADACDLPIEFFVADFWDLAGGRIEPALERRFRDLEEQVARLAGADRSARGKSRVGN